jgi:5-methylcytosine-specific restriction endonuclease McrA
MQYYRQLKSEVWHIWDNDDTLCPANKGHKKMDDVVIDDDIPENARLCMTCAKESQRDRDWLALRYDALEKNNGCCCLCGRSYNGVVLNVDHVKPKSIYPELALAPENLQVLCEDCNLGKGNRYETDWR